MLRQWMEAALDWFARVIRHEAVTLLSALALIGTSLWEIGDTLASDLANLELSTGHGVLIFGTVHALRGVQELIEHREQRRASRNAPDLDGMER